MNERIKELAKVAGFRSDVTVTDRHDNYIVTTTGERLEQFAEMIVRECASLFPRTFTDEQYQRRIDRTIRKHFGVEE